MEEPKRQITYIDGFNLYYGLREKGWQRFLWLNLRELALKLTKPPYQIVCVKYFTSTVLPTMKDPDKSKRQQTYLDALATLPDFEIIYGRYKLDKVQCPMCFATQCCNHCKLSLEKHTEKKTDVNIAVEMLTDAFTDKFDRAMLITGDNDLVPAVQKIRELSPQKEVIVAFPPKRHSNELTQVASCSMMIGRAKFNQSQFPDQVETESGFVLQKPTGWISQ